MGWRFIISETLPARKVFWQVISEKKLDSSDFSEGKGVLFKFCPHSGFRNANVFVLSNRISFHWVVRCDFLSKTYFGTVFANKRAAHYGFCWRIFETHLISQYICCILSHIYLSALVISVCLLLSCSFKFVIDRSQIFLGTKVFCRRVFPVLVWISLVWWSVYDKDQLHEKYGETSNMKLIVLFFSSFIPLMVWILCIISAALDRRLRKCATIARFL